MSVFGLGETVVAAAYPPGSVPSAFQDLINTPDGAGQYLIELSAYIGGETRSGGLATLAEIPTASIPTGGGTSAGEVTLTYADRHWTGSPTDADKPNEFYEGRAEVPLVFERVMPIIPEGARRVVKQFGTIRLANNDGALDSIVHTYAIDGRRAKILFGPYLGAYSDFNIIADVLAVGWESDEDAIEVSLRSQSFSLDKTLQTNLFDGTGGAEGTADIEGKPKPLCFGKVLNITPVLIDPTNLIYQVHDGSISDVVAVYDQGVALTDSGVNVSGYTNLVAESPAAGNFTSANDVGMFMLASSPSGLITCDILGDATPDYADTVDVIALRVLQNVAGISPGLIGGDTFAGLAAIAGEMGFYLHSNEVPTTAEVIDVLVGSVGGWWGAARDRRIRAGRLSDPADGSPVLMLDEFSLIDFTLETSLVPRWRQRVGYQRNWTIQRGEDLAAGAARRQFLAEPFRVVSSADATVKVRHLEASDPSPLVTLYDNEAQAQALADLLKDLYAPNRRLFQATIKRKGYLLDLSNIVRVTWPRFGLQNGMNLMIVGIREDADRNETILRLWG